MYKAKGPGGLVKRRSSKAAEARAAAAAAGGGAQPHQKGEAGQGWVRELCTYRASDVLWGIELAMSMSLRVGDTSHH